MQYLLSVENGGNKYGGLAALCAGQAFANLIYQLSAHLGIILHISLLTYIDLVFEWCQLRLRQGIIDWQVMPYLFPSVAKLLVTNPEQAIKILSRWGRHLLNYAKRSYRVEKNWPRRTQQILICTHVSYELTPFYNLLPFICPVFF